MAIYLKTPEEIEKMRIASHLANEVLDMIAPYVQPGITTNELDKRCFDYITKVQKAFPSPLNYKGYPKSICTSVNHQVCHAIPSDKVLKDGDIVNLDVTVMKNGYHGDTSRMFMVGNKVSIMAKRLIEVSYECLWAGIAQVKPGGFLGDVGTAIQRHAESKSCTVVRDYCGHGIGRDFHEEPQVLHHADTNPSEPLRPGLTFTIEPMVNTGKHEVKRLPDGWTVVTKDHKLSAQWEHTVAVTDDGVDVLTLRPDEKIPPAISATYPFLLSGFPRS
jgi:methionyl aminopeptidase